MNDRIKELAVKAGANWNHGDFNMGSSVEFQEDDLEKFAELIVRECVNCSDDLVKHYIANHNESDQTLLLASIADYTSEIKKHFGVEE